MTQAMVKLLPREALLGSILFGLCAVGAASAAFQADHERPSAQRVTELSYLPKGEYLRIASLGYRQLFADMIWIQVVHHLGKKQETAEGSLWAYHAVDVLTDLDPTFSYAYEATGTVLVVWGGKPKEGIALLTKGIPHDPTNWRLPFYAGYAYYYELHSPQEAAKYLRMAADLPGAPAYLPQLAARMTVEAGDPDAAVEFVGRMLEQAKDERVREGLLRRMQEVVLERDIHLLEEAVRQYRAERGAVPHSLDQLREVKILRQLPVEPFGGVYVLQPNGRVRSSTGNQRLHVYTRS
jgi:tetratricopeptide (TPR) repeat protein